MRLGILVPLAILSGCYAFAAEDLRSVQEAFRKKDAALDWFDASRKKPIDAIRSVMVVQAGPTALQPAGPKGQQVRLPVQGKTEIGVFVVSGVSNQVQLVLDVLPEGEISGFPEIDVGGPDSVKLHFYSEYGIYEGSIKYFFDSGKPVRKFRYGMLALTSSRVRNGVLTYTGSALGKESEVVIEPRLGDALPVYKVTPVPANQQENITEPAPMKLPDGGSVQITNTPVGQVHRAAGISVTSRSGVNAFYPVPVLTMAEYRRLRPESQPQLEIENNIGPFVLCDSTLWFANDFYDGEGTSGVGAIGSFDLRMHKFEMRYLPEIVKWSGSAMRLDGDDLWIGLMSQPEGAATSGGLLRFDTNTGRVAKYEIPDYIHTIDRAGDTIYCGTSNGVYRVHGGDVTQLRFEPDASGKLTLVAGAK